MSAIRVHNSFLAPGLGVAKCTFHETGLRVKPLLPEVGATFVIRCDSVVSTLNWPDFDADFRGTMARQTVRRPLHCVQAGLDCGRMASDMTGHIRIRRDRAGFLLTFV